MTDVDAAAAALVEQSELVEQVEQSELVVEPALVVAAMILFAEAGPATESVVVADSVVARAAVDVEPAGNQGLAVFAMPVDLLGVGLVELAALLLGVALAEDPFGFEASEIGLVGLVIALLASAADYLTAEVIWSSPRDLLVLWRREQRNSALGGHTRRNSVLSLIDE